MNVKLAVLASGRGSNFQAIAAAIERGDLHAEITILISDRATAAALSIAREHHIHAEYLPYDKNDREAFERRAAALMKERGCDLVILAGFMRILTPYIIGCFPDRILNIHPSLLPAFKGLDAQKQALEHGVKIAGCTVHVVTEEMDGGPIIGQRVVSLEEDDTEETLSARILEQEYILYPEAIAAYGERVLSGRCANKST